MYILIHKYKRGVSPPPATSGGPSWRLDYVITYVIGTIYRFNILTDLADSFLYMFVDTFTFNWILLGDDQVPYITFLKLVSKHILFTNHSCQLCVNRKYSLSDTKIWRVDLNIVLLSEYMWIIIPLCLCFGLSRIPKLYHHLSQYVTRYLFLYKNSVVYIIKVATIRYSYPVFTKQYCPKVAPLYRLN